MAYIDEVTGAVVAGDETYTDFVVSATVATE